MINEKFNALSKQKQLAIINAGLEVFGRNDYKRAITDDVANKANISKGLLFHYFKNKKTFYMYLYNYCMDIMKQLLMDDRFYKIDDFFELLHFGAVQKIAILTKHPYIMDFVMRAFYSKGDDISEEINVLFQKQLKSGFEEYFKHVDFSKFKEDVRPEKIYQVLIWMSEGYLLEKMKLNVGIDVDEIMADFEGIISLVRNMSYKEEYL